MHELLSDETTRGIELAATPVVFGGLGWLVDGWAGTGPWLAIAFAAFALLGTAAKMWFAYDAEMRAHEATARWASGNRSAAPNVDDDTDLWADRKASQG